MSIDHRHTVEVSEAEVERMARSIAWDIYGHDPDMQVTNLLMQRVHLALGNYCVVPRDIFPIWHIFVPIVKAMLAEAGRVTDVNIVVVSDAKVLVVS